MCTESKVGRSERPSKLMEQRERAVSFVYSLKSSRYLPSSARVFHRDGSAAACAAHVTALPPTTTPSQRRFATPEILGGARRRVP